MQNQSTTNPNSTTSNKDTSSSVKDSKWKIYCDMDGVLCDFEKRFGELSPWNIQYYIDKNGLDEFWKVVDNEGIRFWAGMDWMEDGKQLWEFLTKNYTDIELLSSPSRAEHSRIGKHLWVRNHKLGVKLNLALSKHKQRYAAPNHILIDDKKSNIEEWESQGGIGILHTSTEETIVQLLNIVSRYGK
jgi:FMN phosphatase YigB (HAD superfamily)